MKQGAAAVGDEFADALLPVGGEVGRAGGHVGDHENVEAVERVRVDVVDPLGGDLLLSDESAHDGFGAVVGGPLVMAFATEDGDHDDARLLSACGGFSLGLELEELHARVRCVGGRLDRGSDGGRSGG